MSTRSTNRSFKKLITERDDVSPDDIYQALCNQNVELVFTAHPTQVHDGGPPPCLMLATYVQHTAYAQSYNYCQAPSHFGTVMHMIQAVRGSLLKKYAKIRTEIDRLHNSRMSPYEKTESLEAIRSHIMAAWRTDEIRRTKPSPQVCHLHVPLPHRSHIGFGIN